MKARRAARNQTVKLPATARPPDPKAGAEMLIVWTALSRTRNFRGAMETLGWSQVNLSVGPDDVSAGGGRFVYALLNSNFVVKIQRPKPRPFGSQSLQEWKRWKRFRRTPVAKNLAAIYLFGTRHGNWITFMERVKADDTGLNKCPLTTVIKWILKTREEPQFGRAEDETWKAFDYGY